MVVKRKAKIRESDVTGLKFFDKLAPLMQRLHDEGCQRDRAGNRKLHYDQYCMLVLLYMFNPIVTSLRGIQQASELKNVQKKLGCSRTSLGSLSGVNGDTHPAGQWVNGDIHPVIPLQYLLQYCCKPLAGTSLLRFA